ncbi:hypothetical protein BS47DRAFT_1394415 [Hydnum rufescens UP504]|uniref:Vta1 C-terminal domain-containing protein n=1 Tax=Hydnum rufescens UP504 TaxID=1448309 RepID=A0A9P6DW21_9AGAM|nr:hypothetical protein BS47DRAFT_1394415 [Hydnum rufescens UP504]
MSYVLPNGAANIHTGSSLVAGSSAEITPAATARLPPPPIPSVPNGSTSSGSASGGLQARPGTGNGLGNVNGLTSANPRANRPTLPSAPSPSPRQGTAPIPPISAILPEIPPPPRTAHLDFPSVPTDRASNSTSLQGPIHPNPGLPPVPLAPFYPPTPYPRLPTLPDSIAPEDNARAKKHAKFAMSALDYDDLSTARRELVWALAVLGVDVAL